MPRTSNVAARTVAVVVLVLGLVAVTGVLIVRGGATPEEVAPVVVGRGATGGLTGAAAGPVPGLERVEGVLQRRGDDPEDLALGELDLGPEEWVVTAGDVGDYDGDGVVEPLLDELQSLLGRPVTVLGALDEADDGDDDDDVLVVYELDGVGYRDATGGAPPWERPSDNSSEVSSRDAMAAAAIAAVQDGARIDEIDQVDAAGDVAWDVEVVDEDGVEHRVLLDVAARVLDERIN